MVVSTTWIFPSEFPTTEGETLAEWRAIVRLGTTSSTIAARPRTRLVVAAVLPE
jgi:hypothetical protein